MQPAADVPFFLELVGYEESGDDKGIGFARKKPDVVAQSMAEFSKPQYGVDILKVEVPVNMAFVQGSKSCKGEFAYTRDQAKEHFRRAAAAGPEAAFIYLSAGVEQRGVSRDARPGVGNGCKFSGVLCGRATWKDGIPVYAKQGIKALEDWLGDTGVKNIKNVNDRLKAAKPWYGFYGASSADALASKAGTAWRGTPAAPMVYRGSGHHSRKARGKGAASRKRLRAVGALPTKAPRAGHQDVEAPNCKGWLFFAAWKLSRRDRLPSLYVC